MLVKPSSQKKLAEILNKLMADILELSNTSRIENIKASFECPPIEIEPATFGDSGAARQFKAGEDTLVSLEIHFKKGGKRGKTI